MSTKTVNVTTRKIRTYTVQNVKDAVFAVQQNNVSPFQASKQFGVPRSTLLKKLSGESNIEGRAKVEPRLGWEVENKIIAVIMAKAERGEKIIMNHIPEIAYQISRKLKLKSKIKTKPGTKWGRLFLRRHPQVADFIREYQKHRKEESNDRKPLIRDSIKKKKPEDMGVSVGPLVIRNRNQKDRISMKHKSVSGQKRSRNGAATFVKEDTEIIEIRMSAKVRGPSDNRVENEPADVNTDEERLFGVKLLPRRPSRHFTARNAEAAMLEEAVLDLNNINIAVSGPAGFGKTELVLFVLGGIQHHFHHILWVDASSQESTYSSFRKSALMLNIPVEEHFPLLISNVFAACGEYRSLIVYDNTPGPQFLDQHLPLDTRFLRVIVTSQYSMWDLDFNLNLTEFSPASSLQFLKSALPDLDDTEADVVCKTLGNHPLALQILVDMKRLRDELFGKPQDLISLMSSPDFLFQKMTEGEENGYTKPLSSILDTALELVHNSPHSSFAMEVLKAAANCDLDSGLIPLSSLLKLRKNNADLTKTLFLLKKYSILQKSEAGVKLHPVFKRILLNK